MGSRLPLQRQVKTLTNHTRQSPLFVAAVLFGIVGIILLYRSYAAGSVASFEAEDATQFNGAAAAATDPSASSQAYIQFRSNNQPGTGLSINASTPINPFNRKMKGIGLANWTFTKGWNKPFVGEIQGLPQAISAIDPGIIRYAGGLWANSVGFDRNRTQVTAYTTWTKNGMTYYFSYGTDELASVDSFAKRVNADVIIQVNISNNDPAMWADLVRYAKEREFTSFKYYEFGNEIDLETANGSSNQMDPTTYGNRVAAYQTAMLAVDPTIRFVGGVPASAVDVVRNNWTSGGNQVSQYITRALPAARGAGKDLDAVSYHWYQTDAGSSAINDVTVWTHGIPSTSSDFWKQSYSREWSGLVAPWVQANALRNYPNTQQGISELGVNSADAKPLNGNHIAALWYSDVLGRLAYTGVDWVTQWNSYAASGEDFSLMYPDSESSMTPNIHLRPSYYAYLMYEKYFGDQVVQSNTYDASKISIWASKDSNDPGKLKLRITNISGSAITVPVQFSGYNATSGLAYVLSSTNPTDLSASSGLSTAPTTINGVKLDGNSVANSVANIQPRIVTVSGSSFSYTFPAYSSTAIVLSN